MIEIRMTAAQDAAMTRARAERAQAFVEFWAWVFRPFHRKADKVSAPVALAQ